jgi:hypothetical protein
MVIVHCCDNSYFRPDFVGVLGVADGMAGPSAIISAPCSMFALPRWNHVWCGFGRCMRTCLSGRMNGCPPYLMMRGRLLGMQLGMVGAALSKPGIARPAAAR